MPSSGTLTHRATAQSASRARSKVALGSPAAAHTAIGAAAAAEPTEKAAVASNNNAAAAIVLLWGRGKAADLLHFCNKLEKTLAHRITWFKSYALAVAFTECRNPCRLYMASRTSLPRREPRSGLPGWMLYRPGKKAVT